MAELTVAEILRFRRKIDDVITEDRPIPAFTDFDLQDIWTESGERWNKAIVIAIDELLMSAAKLTDYVQNDSQEKRSQVAASLKALRGYYQQKVDDEIAAEKAKQQVVMAVLRPPSTTPKEKP